MLVLNAHDTRRVSVTACVEPRTVRQYLRGEAVRSTCAARIVTALHELGLARLVVDLPNPALPARKGPHGTHVLDVHPSPRASDEEE